MSSDLYRAPADSYINALLVLSDGTVYTGRGAGAYGTALGEICFNTAMTGYQEILTDPSYAGQIITFTFPHIGNTGCNAEDTESRKPFCKGAILREDITAPSSYRSDMSLQDWAAQHGLTLICGPDTRALTRDIREHGPRSCGIHYAKPGEALDSDLLLEQVRNTPTLEGAELAEGASRRRPSVWEQGLYKHNTGYTGRVDDGSRPHVAVVDYGVKQNILRCLYENGFDVTTVPARATYNDIMRLKPDGVMLSNGPGDPEATAKYALPAINELVRHSVPVFGICLGHQLLALASGMKTGKMQQGHRGANHPVKNLLTGKVEITSQNHGFCVNRQNAPSFVEITHISLFDGTVQGLRRKDSPAFSVQYHPESSPGPHDSRYLFGLFREMIAEKRKAA